MQEYLQDKYFRFREKLNIFKEGGVLKVFSFFKPIYVVI